MSRLARTPRFAAGQRSIVRIPSGLRHRVVSLGPEPLDTLVIYNPLLQAH
jgi:oxalate decarboxylase/phosphoglucose isomerase-like protein (cupin superfamily)